MAETQKMPVPVIGEHERSSPVWLKIRKYVEARLDLLRAQNDADKDERATARLRGRIAELKVLLLLDRAIPTPEDEQTE